MYKLLIISSSEKGVRMLGQILGEIENFSINTASNGGEARRLLIENEYDFILINAPLTDEKGVDLAIDISQQSDSGIIMLVRAENADYIQECVEDYGVYVVPKPLSRQLLQQALKFVGVSRKRILELKENQSKLEQKIEDIKIIDRAKCCLIQYLNMTEAQAHRYIEKQAMDRRRKKRSIAEDILRTYEM